MLYYEDCFLIFNSLAIEYDFWEWIQKVDFFSCLGIVKLKYKQISTRSETLSVFVRGYPLRYISGHPYFWSNKIWLPENYLFMIRIFYENVYFVKYWIIFSINIWKKEKDIYEYCDSSINRIQEGRKKNEKKEFNINLHWLKWDCKQILQ